MLCFLVVVVAAAVAVMFPLTPRLTCASLVTHVQHVTRVTRFESHFDDFPIWLPRAAGRTKGGARKHKHTHLIIYREAERTKKGGSPETQTHIFDYLQRSRENKMGRDLSRRGAIYQ